MTQEPPDDILDELFHGCALRAYLEQAAADRTWPPDSAATRDRAFRLYEAELAAKNRSQLRPFHASRASPAGAFSDRSRPCWNAC